MYKAGIKRITSKRHRESMIPRTKCVLDTDE